MKELRKKIIYWILQIVGWMFYGTLLFLAAFRNADNQFNFKFNFNLSLHILVGIILSHFLRNIYLKRHYFHFNALKLVFGIIFYSGLISFFFTLSNKLISSFVYLSFPELDYLSILLSTASNFVVFSLWSSIYITYHLFEDSRKKEIYNILLTKTQVELELQNLRSQLNPHFLFNSLNAIRALIEVEPAKAKMAINQLSNLLRSTLTLNTDKTVSIMNEIELVDAYLQLEKIRFEERLTFRKSIDDNCLFVAIPAFTVQTLVENAIKHGISKLINGGFISISIYQKNNKCIIKVLNSGKLGTEVDLGIGLSNLNKRLNLQYNSDFSFFIVEIDNCVEVRIEVPLNFKV